MKLALTLKITDNLRDQFASHPLHSQQKINADNTVEIPAVAKETLFPFLLSQMGQADLLEPQELRAELKQILKTMQQSY